MNWKKFKNKFIHEKQDEACFIIGIDLGNATSAIAFYDVNNNTPEIIDISGGYGKPTVPTVMQYINDTKEWVFGEYALLNRSEGRDITLSSLMEKLGRKEYVEIDRRPVSVASILGMYLKELLGNVNSINPKAEIVGIIVSIPSYLGEDAKDELLTAFKLSGYEKEVINLVSDRECIFSRYYFDRKIERERVVLLDFGSRELRGGVYEIEPNDGENITVKSLSSLFDTRLGTDNIDETLNKFMTQTYCMNMNTTPTLLTQQVKDNIKAFVYQHKDLLFQKSQKPVRLYYNFAYPPFQQTITKDEMVEIINPFRHEFIEFVDRVLEKNMSDDATKIKTSDIRTIICTGGGFEMTWAREVVQSIFEGSNIVFYKNSKCVVAEGASVIAAKMLEVTTGESFTTEDKSQVHIDIGLNVTKDKKTRFIPIIERNSFWWQAHEPKFFLVNSEDCDDVKLELFERNLDGDLKLIGDLVLDDLPKRPKGTTKIKFSLEFLNYNEVEATISDLGFGEIFPSTDYERKFLINIFVS